MVKSFIKSKSEPNQLGPGFRTPSMFRGSMFSKSNQVPNVVPKFNPSQFRTQHKGGGGK
jgi:hypothetical protein